MRTALRLGGPSILRTARRGMAGEGGKVMVMENVNEKLVRMEYAVRGPLVVRAVELEKELKAGVSKPFKSVIKANIGDAHAMGQRPITFLRQILALTTYPELLKSPDFPEDLKARARELLSAAGGGSLGAYTMSQGIELIRNHVAEYITRRDGGIPACPDSIFLTGGASEAIRNLMKMFIRNGSGPPVGVMIPIPQYPLYSATVAEFGLGPIGYYLDESKNWAITVDELERAIKESKDKGQSVPRVLVVINPGNPTGQVQTKEGIQDIIRFAHKHKLFIFADEVYQDNVYAQGSQFYSFKKVMTEMGEPYSKMELASFHSCSKGWQGECGLRGGYAEIINMDPDALAVFKKSITAKLCSTSVGQVTMDCVVKPPVEGEPSYALYKQEREAVLKSLADRAKLVEETYASIPGITVNTVQGAMYAFPRLHLPPKAIEAAQAKGQQPDFFYAWALLEETGICIVPGSGFGQVPGTYHFRTTILPQPDTFKDMMERFKGFHTKFMEKYA